MSSSMDKSAAMRARTKSFALRVMKLTASLPNTTQGRVIANQLMKSGTSVAANYRAVCRSKSRKDFIAKLGIVIEESDESSFWLEVIIESGMQKKELVESLLIESEEITTIMVSSRSTAIRATKCKNALGANHE